jgi:hypothetical protein
VRRLFSERAGIISPRNVIQKDDIDDRLASRMWTVINYVFIEDMADWLSDDPVTKFFWLSFYDNFLGRPIDEISDQAAVNTGKLRELYFNAEGLSPSFRRHRMLCHRACKSVMFAYCSAHASQMEKR